MKNIWMAKALTQKALSLLPGAHHWNKWFQKHVTRGYWLSTALFERKREHALKHINAYQRWQKTTPRNERIIPRVALEIGTGWYPVVPLSLIAAGVERVYSVDIVWLCTKKQLERTLDLFLTQVALDEPIRERFFEARLALSKQSLVKTLADLGVHYLIGDARHLSLPEGSVDLVHSNNTFEHIPAIVLEDILKEFERVLCPGGVQTHFIDLTDHFAHFDRSITPYHFLQFSDRAWSRIDNSIQPMNRLRQSDYLRMYDRVGLERVEHTWEPGDLTALSKVRLSARFASYAPADSAITHCSLSTVKGSIPTQDTKKRTKP